MEATLKLEEGALSFLCSTFLGLSELHSFQGNLDLARRSELLGIPDTTVCGATVHFESPA